MTSHMSNGTNWIPRGGKVTEARNGVMRLEEQEEEYTSRTTMASQFFRGRQFLYIVIALLAILSLGLFIGILVASGHSDSGSSNDGQKLCDTAGCVSSACNVLGGMDLQQDPCQDFYTYSCGHWNDIPDDKSVYGINDKAEDEMMTSLQIYLSHFDAQDTNVVTQTKSFYVNCTSSNGQDFVRELVDKLSKFGGWPINDGAVVNVDDFLSELVSFTVTKTPVATTVFNNGLFSIFIRKDEFGKNAIYLDEPELGLDPQYLLGTDDDSKAKVDIYNTFIANSLQLFNTSLTVDECQDIANDIINFERSLAENLLPVTERRDKSWDEKSRSVAEVQGYFLNEKVTLIDIIRTLFADQSFTISEPISVLLSSNYMNTTVKSVTSAPDLKNLADYIMWRYVQSHSWIAAGKLREYYNDYQKDYTQILHPSSIEDICVKLTNSMLSLATARIYADQNQHINITLASVVAEDIRHQFVVRLQDLVTTGKLNQTTVDTAKEKVKDMQILLGFPQWIMDDKKLENYYNFGTDELVDNLYRNVETMFKIRVQTEKSILRSSVDKTRWITAPVSVQANYDPLLNNLALPMGVLMSPYFIPDQLQLGNFARLGIIVAREMLHGFNIFGRQLNEDGVLSDWWQFKDLIYFNDGVECLAEQYNNYSPQSGRYINGNQTLDENIADNGAVALAYKAAMNSATNQKLPGFPQMTDAQLFFVQYATMHCTAYRPTAISDEIVTGITAIEEYRLKGTLANALQFTEAFKCHRNKSAPCVIW